MMSYRPAAHETEFRIGVAHNSETSAFRIVIGRKLTSRHQIFFLQGNSLSGRFSFTLKAWQTWNVRQDPRAYAAGYAKWKARLDEVGAFAHGDEDRLLDYDGIPVAYTELARALRPNLLPKEQGFRKAASAMLDGMGAIARTEERGYGHDNSDYFHLEQKTGVDRRITNLSFPGLRVPELTQSPARDANFARAARGPLFHYRSGSADLPNFMLLQKFETGGSTPTRPWLSNEPLTEGLTWYPGGDGFVVHSVTADYFGEAPHFQQSYSSSGN
jgi:hypothetical protein